MKNKYIAGFLAMFFGAFGAHKFYLGDKGAGIFYLLLFFTSINIFNFPLSAILGFFDAFRLFTMSEGDFDKKYNRNYKPRRNVRQSQRGDRRRDFERKRQQRPVARKVVPKRVKSNPFKKEGIEKFKDYDIDGAITDFKKALEVDPYDMSVHFNLACAYSLDEQKDNAFTELDKAVELGFKDFDKIKNHDALAYLRIQKEYDDFEKNGFRMKQRSKTQEPDERKDDALLAQLNKLAEMRKKGYISENEFSTRKAELLRR